MKLYQRELPYDNYPVEIFDKIGFYLTSKQVGVCRTVCHAWGRLFAPSQYLHVQIKGERQFNQVYNESLKTGNVGHYLRRLSVEDVDMDSQKIESLSTLCPNLVSFSFNGKIDNSNSSSSKSILSREWKHLRRLTDLTAAHTLLYSVASLSSLTHLEIRFEPTFNKHDFFASLHEASELTDLSLDSVTLPIAEIEIVHQSCPYLQKLRLINATFEPIASTADGKREVVASWRSLEAARFMQTFEYENGSDLHDTYEWLYYISIKYPNLENLELWCAYSVYDPPERSTDKAEERCGALASIGMNCLHLKSVKLLNVEMNHWIFECMDHVGTRLEHLGLSDMTDRTLDILQYLHQSKQNVSSFTLWGWSALCISEAMEEAIAMLGQCSDRLSSLTLSMQFSGIMNAPVPLDALLDHCPNLTHLELDSAQPFFSIPLVLGELPENCMRPSLHHLRLGHGSFRNDIFEYIGMRCPRLKKLEIDSCALISPGLSDFVVDIHMPQHQFDLIRITHVRPPSNYHHAKQASDIRFFDVSVAGSWHQLYELTDFEPYSPSLTFNYEQKPVETTRPTKYILHDPKMEVSPTTFVSIRCQHLKELNIGSFWVH